MPDTPDGELMVAAARGDPAPFEVLVRRHTGPLLGFVRRLVGDAHRAEDVVQETFTGVWRVRDQFRQTHSFKPWLYKSALNRCRDLLRKRPDPAPTTEAELVSEDDGGPIAAAVAVETSALVLAAVDRLPPYQRAVVLLRVWEGLSYGDIGFALAVTETTARSHMHHALGALRVALRRLD
ncbi:MAG TPA: RNA polymerase sigma factor [Gemmataceae bacterium]|nr:RNA polymerase sigma factor [Gemmataceae bacterium]